MPLSPPLCLRASFGAGSSTGNDYTTTLIVSPQTYTANGTTSASYNGTHVAVGMYATSNFDGQVFRIKSITSQTATTVVAVLEDVEGLNKTIDTSGGINGGGPSSGYGYIFEVNSDGLPALTAINNPPAPTFPDSILGRFIFDKKSSSSAITEQFSVIVGSKDLSLSTIATSYDGLKWTGQTSTRTLFNTGYDVLYNGNIWVAVGQANRNADGTYNSILTSVNGTNWTARPIRMDTARAVAWNGSIFVVVGNKTSNEPNSIFTSPDGITWTGRGSPNNSNLLSLVWTGSKFVTAQLPSSAFFSSVDGINWTAISLDASSTTLIGTKYAKKLASNGSNRLLMGLDLGEVNVNSDSTIVYSDNDGITWNNATWVNSQFIVTSFAKSGNNITTIVSATAVREVAIGTSITITQGSGVNGGNLGTFTITAFDINAATITYVNASGVAQLTGIQGNLRINNNILSLTTDGFSWNGQLWVAVGSQTNNTTTTNKRTIATSPDGINWTIVKNTIFTIASGISWNGSTWIACGQGTNTIATSPDGTTWSGLGRNIFGSETGTGTAAAYAVSSRKEKYLTQPQKIKSINVHVRGTGKNTIPSGSTESHPRQVYIDGILSNQTNTGSADRGLYLTVLRGSDLSVVSNTQYNTNTETPTNGALLLTAALNALDVTNIGILSSYREWEIKIDQGDLRTALRRLGLTKLANNAFNDSSTSGRSYAAIFYGAGTSTSFPFVGTRDVIERLHSSTTSAPMAVISATLTTDGTFPSITGANSTNALYNANVNVPLISNGTGGFTFLSNTTPVVEVDSNGATLVQSMVSNQGLKVYTPSPYADISPVPTTFKSQLQIYPKDNPNCRLYLGSYYTGTVGSVSAIQSSDFFTNPPPPLPGGVLRDNPIGLALNPLLGTDQLPGPVTVGKLTAGSGITLDVNGYIRGKGSIVNTEYARGNSLGNNWAYLGDVSLTIDLPSYGVAPYKYVPKQTGSVPIILHGGSELSFTYGSGFDAMGWQIVAKYNVTITRFIQLFEKALLVLDSIDNIRYADTIKITNNSTSTVNSSNLGEFAITEIHATYPFTIGGVTYTNVIVINKSSVVNQAVTTTGEITTTVQSYNQQFDNNNVTGRTTGGPNYFGVGNAYFIATKPTRFSLRLSRTSGDDPVYYKNAYLILHEISNS